MAGISFCNEEAFFHLKKQKQNHTKTMCPLSIGTTLRGV